MVLGKIDPARFSGDLKLDVTGARAAITRDIGAGLKLEPDLAAFALCEIVDENMAGAARVHAIESGKDLSTRTMIAFGGAAPLHAARVARKLGVSRVLIPANAGVGSAIGFLAAGLAFEQARSLYMALDAFEPARANAVLGEMTATARRVLGETGAFVETRLAYMRYRGQGHEITVSLPEGALDAGTADDLRAAFEARYAQLFGQAIPGMSAEVLTWTVRLERVDESEANGAASSGGASASPPAGAQDVFDPVTGKRMRYAAIRGKISLPASD